MANSDPFEGLPQVHGDTMMITSGDVTPIEAFLARAPGPGLAGGVIVLHSVLGYDEDTKRFAQSLAGAGYNAVVPYLFHREAPGAAPKEALAAARARNNPALPNDRVVADAAGAASYLQCTAGQQCTADRGAVFGLRREVKLLTEVLGERLSRVS
jgi:dienelactone hydrolase